MNENTSCDPQNEKLFQIKAPSTEEQIGDMLKRIRELRHRIEILELHTHNSEGKCVVELAKFIRDRSA